MPERAGKCQRRDTDGGVDRGRFILLLFQPPGVYHKGKMTTHTHTFIYVLLRRQAENKGILETWSRFIPSREARQLPQVQVNPAHS